MTEIRTPEDEIDKPGWFTAPFREGWTYQGATYAGHSSFSVDWNRRTPSGGWLEDTGDPVLASADGTVAEVDKGDGLVMINHWGGTYRTESRHMQDIKVKVGDKVQRGDRIGSIGNVAGDGRSFGAHLHAVHYRKVGNAWKRVQMRFDGKPIATSVDSETRPEGWHPPAPVYVQGPPPKATWEGAYREALRGMEKAERQRDEAQGKVGALTEEARLARLAADELAVALQAANVRITELENAAPPDCGPVIAERDAALARITAAKAALEGA